MTDTSAVQLELPLPAASAHYPTGSKVIPGQAHFCRTGPSGATCRQCLHWAHNPYNYDGGGYIRPARCRKFSDLTNKRGDTVSPDAAACRHYEPAKSVPAPFISPDRLQRGFRPWK
jgi:hypothetical protein